MNIPLCSVKLAVLPLLLFLCGSVHASIAPLIAGDGPNDSVRVSVSVNDTLGNAANADTVVVIWSHKGIKFDSLLTTAEGYRTGQYVFVHKASNAGSAGDYQVLVRARVKGRTPITNFSYQVVPGGLFTPATVHDSNLARSVTADDYKADLSAIGLGNGAIPCTLFVMRPNGSDTTALQGVFVRVRNSAETATAAGGTTDANGRIIFTLETSTYHAYGYQTGYLFSPQPETLVVGTGGIKDTLWAVPYDPGAPATANLCRVYGWVRNLRGDTLSGATIQARIAQTPLRFGNLVISPYELTTATDSTGHWFLDLFPTSTLTPNDTQYEFTIRFTSGAILRRKLTVPNSSQWLLTW
ncbi:MAG: hypothetical protein HZB43_12190 [candidate division Zixibacteria bacterium]|nr:hypothetical protein [candidate division Zixibacteria bacterium]